MTGNLSLFPHTHTALQEWERGKSDRSRFREEPGGGRDSNQWQREHHEALRKVQDAFHKDTSDIIAMNHCRGMSVDDIKAMIGVSPSAL